jgi:magnesium chelatase family protein
MLARRMAGILAPLSEEEAVETTRLHSLAGSFGAESDLVIRPPFRSPHHSASAEGILGGGRSVHPGEISLAHNGVLFLDEAPEFKTNVLQALREPLEDSWVTISRADGSVRLPADFQLILAANPCPCGRLGIRLAVPDVPDAPGKFAPADTFSGSAACFCSGDEINRHWRRLGSALLDRIELRVPVLPPLNLANPSSTEDSSAEIALRVRSAVEIQRKRLRGTNVRRNSRMPVSFIQKFCAADMAAASVLRAATDYLGLSGRACHGILRVARTIADLDGSDSLKVRHVEEAIKYRRYGEDPYDIIAASGMPSI